MKKKLIIDIHLGWFELLPFPISFHKQEDEFTIRILAVFLRFIDFDKREKLNKYLLQR